MLLLSLPRYLGRYLPTKTIRTLFGEGRYRCVESAKGRWQLRPQHHHAFQAMKGRVGR